MEDDETRFEDPLVDEKHIAFFTLSATPFRNSIGVDFFTLSATRFEDLLVDEKHIDFIQGILIMQHFVCEYLAALFLVFFFHGMLVFS
ncbi:hypothetical protein TSUD_126860 [Trifolium subterraneum]|nr:hypothetical protein TSUD_126860 [Trifolium subterraneum]